MTHGNEVDVVDRSVAIAGSATLTMVTSTMSMKLPRETATSGSHLRMSASDRSTSTRRCPSRDPESGRTAELHPRNLAIRWTTFGGAA